MVQAMKILENQLYAMINPQYDGRSRWRWAVQWAFQGTLQFLWMWTGKGKKGKSKGGPKGKDKGKGDQKGKASGKKGADSGKGYGNQQSWVVTSAENQVTLQETVECVLLDKMRAQQHRCLRSPIQGTIQQVAM